MLSESDQKGQIAQLKVEIECARRGYTTSRPTTHAKYDLLIDTGRKIEKVQIKYSNQKSSKNPSSVVVELTNTNGQYLKNEINYVLAYLPKFDKIIKIKNFTRNRVIVNIENIKKYAWN